MIAGARETPNVFAAAALDRAAERRADAAWLAAAERDAGARFLLLDGDGRIATTADAAAPRLWDATERRRFAPEARANLLGVGADATWFALQLSALPAAVHGGGAGVDLRAAGAQFDRFHAGLAAYACALARWQAVTRFCRRCGAPLRLTDAGHRAVCSNPDCGHEQFPRTDPAVIMLVERGERCLLGRQASWPAGRYSTLAGFVEPGESLEDAVRREVAEETGVTVGACRYHSSQPWPFPASLMLGFVAEAQTDAIALRDGELEDARWFGADELVAGVAAGTLGLPSRVSIAWQLVAGWLARHGVDPASLRR